MPDFDLNVLYTYSQNLLTTEQQNWPIHLVKGKPAVLEPRAPPGCWTRFKAALVNVPLLGRLQSVQTAVQQLEDARPALEALHSAATFRNGFHERLAARFGTEVARQAIRAGEQPRRALEKSGLPPAASVLTAPRIVDTLKEARSLVSSRATLNGHGLEFELKQSGPSGGTQFLLALLFAEAELQDRYFKEVLSNEELTGATQPGLKLLRELKDAGIDPDEIFPRQLQYDYRSLATNTPVERLPVIYARYRDIVLSNADRALNRRKVERLRPASSAADQAGSSSRGAPPKHEVDIVLALCANADPGDRFSDLDVNIAWTHLETLHKRLSSFLTDLGPSDPERLAERRTQILRNIASGRVASEAGRPKLKVAELHRMARTAVILGELERDFDPNNKESTLWSTVVLATAGHPRKADLNFTAMMGRFTKDLLDNLEHRVPTLHQELGCEDGVVAVIQAARTKLIEHIGLAAKNHLDALEELDRSTTLTAAQKQLFRTYADPVGVNVQPWRLDPVLLEQCQGLANAIVTALPRIQAAIAENSPSALFDGMDLVANTCVSAMAEILKNAKKMWVLDSYNHFEVEAEILKLCGELALAKLDHEGVKIDGALLASPGPSAKNHPVNQFLQACTQSPWRFVSSKIAAFYSDLLGLLPGARPRPAPEAQDEPQRDVPLYELNPQLLVRAFAQRYLDVDVEDGDGGGVDRRGVVRTAPNAHLIKEDFEIPAAWRAPVTMPPGEMLKQIGGKITRMVTGPDCIVDGELPTTPELADAIEVCMNQAILSKFQTDIDAAAFDSVPVARTRKVVHEIWPRPEYKTWHVRSTAVVRPYPPETDGVILYVLEHRITLDDDGGPPSIHRNDAKAVFAF